MPHAHCGPHAPCGGWPQHGARSPRCIRAARLGFTCHGRMSCVLLQGLPRARARVRVKRAISLAAPGSHLGPYPPAAPAAAARIPRCPPPPFPPTAPTAGSSGDKGSTFNQTLAHQTCERGRAWAASSRLLARLARAVPGPSQCTAAAAAAAAAAEASRRRPQTAGCAHPDARAGAQRAGHRGASAPGVRRRGPALGAFGCGRRPPPPCRARPAVGATANTNRRPAALPVWGQPPALAARPHCACAPATAPARG